MVVNKSNFGKDPQEGHHAKDSDSGGAFTVFDSGMVYLDQDLVINKGNITDFYRVDKGAPFATGLYAEVKRAKSLADNTFYAAKFCPRRRPGQSSDEECIENLHEIGLLSQLKHPYIVSFVDAFILADYVVTIMELAPGGDLQTVIDADLVLLEKDASRYIFQLLEALKYLHERHVVHLDIKPQNLLLMGEFPTCDIKLCDFEISRVIKPGKEIKEILGTPDYVAPEILLYEPLTSSADMWSVGILCYVLLTGFSPFGGDTDQETFRNIVHEPIDFPEELFDDISPLAIDFIVKLVVKNAKLRPTPAEIQEHEWLKSFGLQSNPCIPPEPEPESAETSEAETFIVHSGPKKRSPRKTTALPGLSTASAASRRHSARSIIRACKSAYSLNKMGGRTKSREALIEKMKIASGDGSVGGSWKLRKNLSKSREQLWESKIQLSKSCEKINNNFPGSTRWASVANFPSLDLGAMKSSTSQESVISAVSNCTNCGSVTMQELLDWQQQSLDDFARPDRQHSLSMPNTPPIPNFDISAPVTNLNLAMNGTVVEPSTIGVLGSPPPPTVAETGYPSLVNGTLTDISEDQDNMSSHLPSAEQDSQKSVAELIMTFGGRGAANAKKLDLKNQFEPILETEEQLVSLDNHVNNNIISSNKEPRSVESGNYSMNSLSSTEPDINSTSKPSDLTTGMVRRRSRTPQQIRDEMRAMKKNEYNCNVLRRGSAPPSKPYENETLRGILKKPIVDMNYVNGVNHHPINGIHHAFHNSLNIPHSVSPLRRGSIPGNCTRLYDTHTISSLAKIPKSILKNSQNNESRSHRSASVDTTPSHTNNTRRSSGDRPSSKSPENLSNGDSNSVNSNGNNSTRPNSNNNGKGRVIPKGLSPRERPSFILLNDEKPRRNQRTTNKPNSVPLHTRQVRPTVPRPTNKNPRSPLKPTPTPTSKPPPKPRPSIREQILMKKRTIEKSGDRSPTVTVHILQKIPASNKCSYESMKKSPSPPTSPTFENKTLVPKFKSELTIEPAAVTIKITSPDAVSPLKSSLDSLSKSAGDLEGMNNGSSSDTNNNRRNRKLPQFIHNKSNILDTLVIITNNKGNLGVSKSPECRRRLKQDCKNGEKPTWGVVCTGSIGRAMERLETGAIRGKKLRRGSVPDF